MGLYLLAPKSTMLSLKWISKWRFWNSKSYWLPNRGICYRSNSATDSVLLVWSLPIGELQLTGSNICYGVIGLPSSSPECYLNAMKSICRIQIRTKILRVWQALCHGKHRYSSPFPLTAGRKIYLTVRSLSPPPHPPPHPASLEFLLSR